MGRQLVLNASFSLVLLAIVFTPVCHGRPNGEGKQQIHTEDEVDSLLEESLRSLAANEDKLEVEDENENEEELNDIDMLLLSRLLDDQVNNLDNLIGNEMTYGQQRGWFKKAFKKVANVFKGAVKFCKSKPSLCLKAASFIGK